MNNLEADFSKLSTYWKEELAKAKSKGLRRAAALLRKTTKSLVDSETQSHANTKFSDRISDGVMIGRYRKSYLLLGKDEIPVHVFGSRRKNSGTYRLRFLDGGTVERKTKDYRRTIKGKNHTVKGHSTGKIIGKHFLERSYNSSEGRIKSAVENELIKVLNKLK